MENTKSFKLPKPFAVLWVDALRSGKYGQTEGGLISSPETEPTLEGSEFCCLGVAGHVCGYTLSQLETYGYLFEDEYPSVPKELHNAPDENPLVEVLAELNDGLTADEVEFYQSRGYVFRNFDVKGGHVKYDFNQIADFIEDNAEFYEPQIEVTK